MTNYENTRKKFSNNITMQCKNYPKPGTYTEHERLFCIEVLNLERVLELLLPTDDALVQENGFLKKGSKLATSYKSLN